jgi:DNA-binding MarR family transcriptional regulator
MGHVPIGIDISAAMVQRSYETAAEFSHRIEFRIMDAAKMDFESESFDAVICCELFGSISEPQLIWDEIKRVLKKEGQIIALDSSAMLLGSLQSQGFSHCRMREFASLAALCGQGSVQCAVGRKPSSGNMGTIPQIALFSQHIQIAKRQIQLYSNWFANAGIPYAEYQVLNMVARHTKGVRPSDLSSALVVPAQTMTRLLSALKDEGYIDRKTNERDQRSAVITITDNGLKRLVPLQEALKAAEEKALREFSADKISELNSLSEEILNALKAAFEQSPAL